MSNMSYCRFQNTLQALRDCYVEMTAPLTSDEEVRARQLLIKLCGSITEDYGNEAAK